jgi:CubicO group peptidase (beta-lactamase class C family)
LHRTDRRGGIFGGFPVLVVRVGDMERTAQRTRWRSAAAAVTALGLAVAACGDDSGTENGNENASVANEAASDTTDTGDAAGSEVTVTPVGDPVQAWLEELEPWGFRGAVALVVDGETVLASGFGTTGADGEGTPISPNTRFAIGSITKDFVDVALYGLEDRGELALDDQIGDLLPDVPADQAGITVQQLMDHTAGYEHVHGDDNEQIDRDEALDRIFGQNLRFEPGTDEYYSNSGYTLLAAVVEEVAGQDIDDFLREEIFVPLGMHSTGYRGEPLPDGVDEASGLDADDDPVTPSGLPPLSWTMRGNGGIVSTVDDLLTFEQAVCEDGLLPEGMTERLDHFCRGYGTAGGGDEFSHTSDLETTESFTLVVLSADWDLSAEDVALPIARHIAEGEALPEVPGPDSTDGLPWIEEDEEDGMDDEEDG